MCPGRHFCRLWDNRSSFSFRLALLCFFLYSNRISGSIYHRFRIDPKIKTGLPQIGRQSLINIHGLNPKHKIKPNRFLDRRSSPPINNPIRPSQETQKIQIHSNDE